jgi:hypothetical protein
MTQTTEEICTTRCLRSKQLGDPDPLRTARKMFDEVREKWMQEAARANKAEGALAATRAEALKAVLEACQKRYDAMVEEFGGSETAADIHFGLAEVKTIVRNMASEDAGTAAAPSKEDVARAICCPWPNGCVRPDDCQAGKRAVENDQTKAVMALLRRSKP